MDSLLPTERGPRASFEERRISADSMHGLRWNLAQNYDFARDWPWVPIIRTELHRVAQSYVIGFERVAGELRPVACARGCIGALDPARALTPWLDEYCPIFLRLYPFTVRSGTQALSALIDPSCIGPSQTYGFFEPDGSETPALNLIRQRIEAAARGFQDMSRAAHDLNRAELLVPANFNAASQSEEADLWIVSSERLEQKLEDWLPIWAIETPLTIELALVAEFSASAGPRASAPIVPQDDTQTERTDALIMTQPDTAMHWLDEDNALRF